MPKQKKTEFVRYNTIKDYVKDIQKMRSNEAAVNNLTERFNSLIETESERPRWPKKTNAPPSLPKI